MTNEEEIIQQSTKLMIEANDKLTYESLYDIPKFVFTSKLLKALKDRGLSEGEAYQLAEVVSFEGMSIPDNLQDFVDVLADYIVKLDNLLVSNGYSKAFTKAMLGGTNLKLG